MSCFACPLEAGATCFDFGFLNAFVTPAGRFNPFPKADAEASKIAPLLRQKSICELRPSLSVFKLFEHMGHISSGRDWLSVSFETIRPNVSVSSSASTGSLEIARRSWDGGGSWEEARGSSSMILWGECLGVAVAALSNSRFRVVSVLLSSSLINITSSDLLKSSKSNDVTVFRLLESDGRCVSSLTAPKNYEGY